MRLSTEVLVRLDLRSRRSPFHIEEEVPLLRWWSVISVRFVVALLSVARSSVDRGRCPRMFSAECSLYEWRRSRQTGCQSSARSVDDRQIYLSMFSLISEEIMRRSFSNLTKTMRIKLCCHSWQIWTSVTLNGVLSIWTMRIFMMLSWLLILFASSV